MLYVPVPSQFRMLHSCTASVFFAITAGICVVFEQTTLPSVLKHDNTESAEGAPRQLRNPATNKVDLKNNLINS